MAKANVGLIGLGVMGQNLALNMERHGYAVAGYDLAIREARDFAAAHPGKKLVHCPSVVDLVGTLERPRRVMLMVTAGDPVDAVIGELVPLLEPGDIIIDGGNSFFLDTERRARDLEAKGLRFFGTGVSGGEEGALNGASLMVGGPADAYDLVRDLFAALAAQVGSEPCVAYIGPRGAGHYVKMVHNGIEYADMQLIAEAYDILRRALGLSASQLADILEEWSRSELQSYLIGITGRILRQRDEETGQPLVDLILDEAEQKGTGKWASQNALDLGVPIPTINAAVESRLLSALKSERVVASRELSGPPGKLNGDRANFVTAMRDALYMAKVCAYAQGMALLRAASQAYSYDLKLNEIAAIWRGGCIIRAKLLDAIREAFRRDSALPNLLLDDSFKMSIASRQDALRQVVATAASLGIPCLALASALSYYDAYRAERLPANLTQAQRDCFGAHKYRRLDKEGVFHTEWS